MRRMDTPQEPTVTRGEVISEPVTSGEWLTPSSAADRLGMSERTLWRMVKDGRYQKRLVNRRAEILVPVSDTSATGNATETALSLSDRPSDTLALAVIEELRQQRQTDNDRLTRQTDEIKALAERAAAAEARADLLAAELERLRERRWWRFW
jgi:AraC-like DNA-binding protein